MEDTVPKGQACNHSVLVAQIIIQLLIASEYVVTNEGVGKVVQVLRDKIPNHPKSGNLNNEDGTVGQPALRQSHLCFLFSPLLVEWSTQSGKTRPLSALNEALSLTSCLPLRNPVF